MRRCGVIGIGLVLFASACGTSSGSGSGGWTLASAYDASSIRGWEATLATGEEAAGPSFEYVWIDSARMRSSCGTSKAPDGFGLFEAEAIANRHTPVLAILMERDGDAPPLRPDLVRVAIGKDDPEFFLQPAVMPRYLVVEIGGNADVRYKQQVREQLQRELCMEHKTGRGWIGGEVGNIRQAFLLDKPDKGIEGQNADRKYFGGQRDPIPALLGPPDACLRQGDGMEAAKGGGGKGEGNLDLVPSDVWGASLKWCKDESTGTRYQDTSVIPLTLSELGDGLVDTPTRAWSVLSVSLADAPVETDIELTVTLDGESLLAPGAHLFSTSDDGEDAGLLDILTRVPHRYPTLGMAEDPGRYTLLLVPNWQVVEGVRRLFADHVDDPMTNGGRGIQDGVGWILDHPEYLFVQVPSDFTKLDEPEQVWLDATVPMSGEPFGLWAWGYTGGMLLGRKPIALPGPEMPLWDQVALAQRASHQALFLGAASVLGLLMLVGVGRMRDLWTAVPEERVDFWPGPPKSDEEEGDSLEGLEEGGGGE